MDAPRWARWWLVAAGAYNLAWGAFVIARPHALFDWAGAPRMAYPSIWQCVGMIVGVYGIGYLVAAGDPRRHWPIVLVGLLGKVLGPIGFAGALADGTFPLRFGATILTNDLIWWAPFAMILWDAARARDAPDAAPPALDAALDGLADQHGRTLRELADARPVLLVLVRHAGCTFCRETLDDLARREPAVRARGHDVAIATMSPPAENASLARAYGLESASWLSDPGRLAYRALELGRGGFLQLFGPRVIARGVAALARGHGVGRLAGDGFQMPGAFVIERGRVVRAFRHRHAADRPDYDRLVCPVTS